MDAGGGGAIEAGSFAAGDIEARSPLDGASVAESIGSFSRAWDLRLMNPNLTRSAL